MSTTLHPTHEVIDPEALAAGAAVYTPRMLRVYDAAVLGFSNRFVWRCPTSLLLGHYDTNVAARHLDVGVGTGFFLDRCQFPVDKPDVTLGDLSEHALQHAAARITRYRPRIVYGNVLDGLPLPERSFASIGATYLLHCVPGRLDGAKAVAIERLAALLTPGGRLFGATIVGQHGHHSRLARRMLELYNRRGIFANGHDTVDLLTAALDRTLDDVEVQMHGSVAIFAGVAH